MVEYESVAGRLRTFLTSRYGPFGLPIPDEVDLVDEGVLDSMQLLEVLHFLEAEFAVVPSRRLLMGETAFSVRSLTQEVLERNAP